MFDNSKIDNSNLAGGNPIVTYDATTLEKEGFELKYALDPENPVYKQVIDECEKQDVPYKIVEGENHQNHIWIKEKEMIATSR